MNTVLTQHATAEAEQAPRKNFVELKGVTKRFGTNTVLENLDLAIPQGHMVTLLGPSGCGKTTVLDWWPGWKNPVKAASISTAKT